MFFFSWKEHVVQLEGWFDLQMWHVDSDWNYLVGFFHNVSYFNDKRVIYIYAN